MTADFTAAKNAYDNLRDTFLPDTWLCLPNGRKMAFAGIALHSETLDPLVIMIEPNTGLWHAAAPGAVRDAACDASFPDILALCQPATYRHKKGGLYTRLTTICRRDGQLTLYVSNSDKIWWVRPSEMFEDGRFAPEPDFSPLSRDALDI